MGFFNQIFDTNKQVGLLEAKIYLDDKKNASVDFKELHPQLKSIEYIRIVLHYYTRLLCDLPPSFPESKLIFKELVKDVEELVEIDFVRNKNDILNLVDCKISKPETPQISFKAQLFFSSVYARYLLTEMFLKNKDDYKYLIPSFFVLTHEVIKNLHDEKEVDILKSSLKVINIYYKNGINYSDIKIASQIPDIVFLDVMFGDK